MLVLVNCSEVPPRSRDEVHVVCEAAAASTSRRAPVQCSNEVDIADVSTRSHPLYSSFVRCDDSSLPVPVLALTFDFVDGEEEFV